MRKSLIGALVLALALSQAGISTASAAASPFRTAQPQSFSAADLQRYGLDAEAAQKAAALQSKGYHLKVLSDDEAQKVRAGYLSTTTWIVIVVAAVVIVAVAAD
jgi:hypothetical protein